MLTTAARTSDAQAAQPARAARTTCRRRDDDARREAGVCRGSGRAADGTSSSPRRLSRRPAFGCGVAVDAVDRSARRVTLRGLGSRGFDELGTAAKDTPSRGLPLADHVAQRAVAQPLPHDHHHIHGRPRAAQRSERLAYEAFRAVALHGISHAPRGGDAQPRPLPRRRPVEHEDEPRRHHTPTPLLDAQELLALPNSIVGRIPTRGPDIGHRCYFLLLAAVTARRQRPRRRRFWRTARPPRVLSRLRKPCVRSRLVLWG